VGALLPLFFSGIAKAAVNLQKRRKGKGVPFLTKERRELYTVSKEEGRLFVSCEK